MLYVRAETGGNVGGNGAGIRVLSRHSRAAAFEGGRELHSGFSEESWPLLR